MSMLFYVEKEYSDFAAVATSMWPGLKPGFQNNAT